MSSQTSQRADEGFQASRCRAGDPQALAELREENHGPLLRILLSRGASPTEAEDLLADLWADCVPGDLDRPSLLEKFSGKCTLQGWLATVATNRWIDLKRKQTRRGEVSDAGPDGEHRDMLESLPAASSSAKEETLVALLRESLQAAFARCSPEAMVLLRLVYLHELSQREIVRMLGWHESKVSRFLGRAMKEIETHTLSELKKRDSWLELSWQDFVDLCETHQVGFL
jgi:RNA polymerase sigma-70 factor (ECF subfamily)